jgi:predicted ArsR family transcriptional regulator
VTDRWTAVTALADPSRRSLYDYVRRQDHPVGREEAAEATTMSRGLAAFHLDTLVEAGLLTARYEVPAGQPRGRGRAPKVYEPHGDGLSLTIPQRQYELIADILADAVTHGHTPAEVAHRRGRDLGASLSGASLAEVLGRLGFEPRAEAGSTRLLNCPFHALADRHTALVCDLNLHFITGLVAGLPENAQARLAPRPGSCCVEVLTPPAAGQR